MKKTRSNAGKKRGEHLRALSLSHKGATSDSFADKVNKTFNPGNRGVEDGGNPSYKGGTQ